MLVYLPTVAGSEATPTERSLGPELNLGQRGATVKGPLALARRRHVPNDSLSPSTSAGAFLAKPSAQGEEIWPRVGGGSVECAGIINCDREVFSLAGWAGRCERRDLREGEE